MDFLSFIKKCAAEGRVYWSYHANMRLGQRSASAQMVLESVRDCEIIEDNPTDFPLPSCLCLGRDCNGDALHYVIAADMQGCTIRFVTVYRPDPSRWDEEFRKRRGGIT